MFVMGQQATSPVIDHLVSEHQQVVRNGEVECLGCFQVDNEIEFCRLFDWQFARLGPAQNFVDIFGSALEQRGKFAP